MLTLTELRKAVDAMAEWHTARLSRSFQDSSDRIVLVLKKGKAKLNVRLCIATVTGRISVLDELPQAPDSPLQFSQFLKSHFEGGRLVSVKADNNDRVVYFRFTNLGKERSLVFQLLGARSNIFSLDENDLVELSLRPLSETRKNLKQGSIWSLASGKPPDSTSNRFGEHSDLAYLAAVEAHYAALEDDSTDTEIVRKLTVAFRKERASIERKTRKLLAEVQAGERSSEYRRKGELLKSVLSEISPGQESVEVRDPQTDHVFVVELNPKLSPPENLEKYFKTHKKLERQTLRAQQQLGANTMRLENFQTLEEEFSSLREQAGTMQAFSERLDVARHLRRFFPADKVQATSAKKEFRIGKRVLPTRLVPKRYKSSTGLEIWVGKNDEGNDILTMKLSRGNDLFFHLESSPGSHVVLRVQGSQAPPQEAILEASELAVHFSKHKTVTKANVHVAHCKDITKPTGAKHGLVYVHRGKSITLKREQKRLDKILSERIDD